MTRKAAELQAGARSSLPDPDYALPQAVVLRAMLAYFAGSPRAGRAESASPASTTRTRGSGRVMRMLGGGRWRRTSATSR